MLLVNEMSKTPAYRQSLPWQSFQNEVPSPKAEAAYTPFAIECQVVREYGNSVSSRSYWTYVQCIIQVTPKGNRS